MRKTRGGTAGIVAGVMLGMMAGGAGVADAPAAPKTADSAMEAITGGKLIFNLRPRYEYFDQDGKTEVGNAFTNRTLFGWETLPYHGFSLRFEGINVARIGEQHYIDVPTAQTRYPTIADPEDTDVNQLYVDYTGIPDTKIRAGRMALKLDNVRFIGNVEFRQVMQVFNGALIENRSLPNVELQLAHFQRVKNIYAIQRQTHVEIARAAWTFKPENQLVAYGYFQDQPNTGQVTGLADNSNRILGLRANGAWPLSGAYKLPYTAEYAKQDKYADGDAKIDASYWRLGAGVQRDKTFIRFDHEHLGSNNGLYAFQTPLGTNHLFQGWVDLFLVTPVQGIRDSYVSAGTMLWGVQLYTELHDLRSAVGNLHYGKEWDIGITKAFTKQLTGKMEYGAFREDDVLTPASARKRDSTKFWLTMIYNY